MRVGLGLCLFLLVGGGAFLADDRPVTILQPATDTLTTGSVERERTLYQASVDGSPLQCWLSKAVDQNQSYRFVGGECARIGVGFDAGASVEKKPTGDLLVSDVGGRALLRLFATDGDGWEAVPGSGRLISLIGPVDQQ